MTRGDSPSVVSFHNPIILFFPVSTVAKMTRIQDSCRTKCAAQTTPEIRMQTSLSPAWTDRIQEEAKSVGAESELRATSLSSQCSCAGRGTRYHSSRPCFVLCGLVLFPKNGFTLETFQLFCRCPQGSGHNSGSCGRGGFVSLWCWQDIKSELHQPRSPQLQYLRYSSQWVPEAWSQHEEVSGHCSQQIIIKS